MVRFAEASFQQPAPARQLDAAGRLSAVPRAARGHKSRPTRRTFARNALPLRCGGQQDHFLFT